MRGIPKPHKKNGGKNERIEEWSEDHRRRLQIWQHQNSKHDHADGDNGIPNKTDL